MTLKFNMVKRGFGHLLVNTAFHKILAYQDMVIASLNNNNNGNADGGTVPEMI